MMFLLLLLLSLVVVVVMEISNLAVPKTRKDLLEAIGLIPKHRFLSRRVKNLAAEMGSWTAG